MSSADQKLAKSLYIAYKRNMKLELTIFKLVDDKTTFTKTFDNDYWCGLSEQQIEEIINDNPTCVYDFSFIDDDSGFYLKYTHGAAIYTFCQKVNSGDPFTALEINRDDLNAFLQIYGGN